MAVSRQSTNPGIGTHSDARYDVIVIGAGGIGSAAAYHCAREGKKVLLLEQFSIGHTRGSSHGGSRIFRYIHDKMEHADQMPATFELWRQLERESGTQIMTMTGGLYFSPEGDSWITRSLGIMDSLNWPYRILAGAELREAYPQFQMPDDWYAVEQPQSGIIAASRSVAVMVAQATRYGATVRENCPVADITAISDGVIVHTETGENLGADRLIICAGPWASRFLGQLLDFAVPLAVTRQQVVYFPVENEALFSVGRCPVYITTGAPHIYGFPIFERAGNIKVALSNDSGMSINPDEEREAQPDMVEELCDVVGTYFRGVRPTPTEVVPCLYTETPTNDFVIDRHPEFPQIVFAAGFSGRGFKHAIAIGKLLSDLAATSQENYKGAYWRESYRLDRFLAVRAP